MAAEDEVVADYRSSLDDLKMNSKPLINMLTMLAEENKQFAAQFVEVIEERVLKASPSEKLPAMYLIDSIIKNLSDSNYLQLFSKNIVTTFAAVFEKVDEKTRSALFKLRHTWNDLFAMKVLYELDLGVRDIDPAWPVLPGAKIHVNPKFLPQAQPEEKKTEAEAETETGSEHLEQQRIQEVNRESCFQLENDILLKQQLMAKQQEILKLHQQRLEIELAKARAQVELQAKLLQKEKDAAKEREREAAKEKEADAAKRSQAKESTSPKKPLSTARAVTKPSTATTDKSSVRSSNRDPRIRAAVDVQTSKNTLASPNKHAAVQSSKSDGGTSLSDSDAVASSGNASTKTQTNASGNIFDRMQDLSSSKEHRSPAKNGTANSETSQSPRLVGSEDSNVPLKSERNKTEKRSSPGKQGSTEDKSTSLKSSPRQKKTGKDGSKKCEGHASDGTEKSSRSTKSAPDGALGKDSNAQQRRPLKSAHPRPGGTSDHPPAKVVKRSDHSPRVSNFKSGPQRSRKNSFREDRATSKVQPLLGERHFEGRKRSRQHESSSAKGFKKPKPATRLEIKHPHQLSDDLKELFGSEDRDYRCLSGGALGSCHESSGFKDMTIAPPPAIRRDSLLLSPPIPTSQSSGWAQFKASRPEDFPYQQMHSRDGLDGDIRSSLLVSPVVKAVARRAPLLPTPLKVDTEDGLRPSASSTNTGQVTMDALEQQMTELHRLQDMKRKLDEQREHLIRNSSLGSFGASPNVSPVDEQTTELHRLQSLKRNLDEQQERLQAMIDSGMKISDEFSSVFPAFGKDLFHQTPRIHNKYLDSNEDSSRSPIFRENSPRRDRFYVGEEKASSGLLGDRPPPPGSAFEPRGEESKALLPTPCLERNAPSKFNHKMGQDILLPCEDDRFYYPERDARWAMRVQTHGSRVSNVYNVVIDGRHYEMMLGNRPLKIWHYGKEVVVRLDPATRTLWCNDNAVYHLGEDEKSVQLNGKPHRVFVLGPPRKLWIDNQLFDISVDSPPEKINIGGKEHKICIDGGKNRIIVDGFDICPFGTDEHQLVKLAFVMHTIQFQPPCKQILIDGKLCNLDLSGKYPVVVIDGKTRGIRFDGPPQLMFVDDKPWTVAVDGSRRCHLDGPSSKPVVLAFGGPGHEIIVDDQWYELKFGGVEKYIKVGRKMRKFQLMGNPPEVKILGEVAFLTAAGGVNNNGRLTLLTPDGGRPPPPSVQCFVPGAQQQQQQRHHPHHPIAPDVMHHQDSSENIPSLLNLNFDSKMDRSRSYSQFPHNQEPFNQSFGADQSVHGVQPMGGPPGRPVDGSFGPGRPYDQGQHRDGASRSAPFGEPGDPHLRPSQNKDASHRGGGHDLPGRLPAVGHRPLQMGLLRDHPGPQFGLDVPPSNQNFGQFPCPGDVANAQWNVDLAFSAAPAGSEEISGNTGVPQQDVDVNSLLSKLLAAGLIKKTSENNSSDGKSSGGGLQPPEMPKKSEVSDAEASEEEEEMEEDVSDLTDFNLENLKKKYSGVIQRVFLGVQCQTCGIRFLSTAVDRYNEHLDWHFRRNRREKEEMKVAKFRRWYYDVVDWIQFEELSNTDDQLLASNLLESTETSKAAAAAAAVVIESEESNVITCPMASRDGEDICDTCRESFEQFWDEEKEAWHLRDAIQVDGKTYHPICYEDAKTAISAVDVDEETPSVLEPTDDGKKSNETEDSETAKQATEHPSNPETEDDDGRKEISSPLDNLQQNETETEMNANVLINSELLDQDVKPHNLSSNVSMSNDSPSLGSDATILIKCEDGVSRCHSADDVGSAPVTTAVKEEPQNESN